MHFYNILTVGQFSWKLSQILLFYTVNVFQYSSNRCYASDLSIRSQTGQIRNDFQKAVMDIIVSDDDGFGCDR